MLDFIAEALESFAETHATFRDGGLSNALFVKVDLGDGEGLKWFAVTAKLTDAPYEE